MKLRPGLAFARPACWPFLAAACLAGTACGQVAGRHEGRAVDAALVQEQHRRIAMFDSVVRTINTDSVYRLWRWSLTLPNPKVGRQQVECETGRLMHHFGIAATAAALRNMEDTLWRNVDAEQLSRLRTGLRGISLPVNPSVCGPDTTARAPYWLRNWTVYPLPQLPPSATDSAPRHP